MEKPIDLQLPITKNVYDYTPKITNVYEPPPPRVFKEKTVSSLDDEESGSSSTFKKRKFGNKRNVRQRFDDED